MFILLTDNSLNADTCQEEIKSKKCFVCVCVQHCAVGLSTVLRQFIPVVLSVQSEVQYSQSKHNLFITQNQLHFSANI